MSAATILALLVTLATPNGQPPAKSAADVTLDEAVDGVQKFYQGVTDFKAKFEQVVKRKNLPRKRKHRGKVFFKKPGMMRWDYSSPEKVYYVSDGEVLWSYQVEDRIVYKMRVKESELYTALKFLFGEGDVKKEFNAKLGKPADGRVKLELTPKVKQSNFKRLDLFVDPGNFQIHKTALIDPLDNVSTVTFKDVKFEKLKAEAFKFKVPSGVRVEDLQAPAKKTKAAPAPAKKTKAAPAPAPAPSPEKTE